MPPSHQMAKFSSKTKWSLMTRMRAMAGVLRPPSFVSSGSTWNPNERLRLRGPGAQWANPMWKVELKDRDQDPICPYMLVTDDGEYLILIGEGLPLPSEVALSIYRRPGRALGDPGSDHGTLVRKVFLSELWPAQKKDPIEIDKGDTPAWFAGGNFLFSVDNRALIHKNRWGKCFRITLATGTVSPISSSAFKP